MSSEEAPVDNELLAHLAKRVVEEGFAAFDEDFAGVDFGMATSNDHEEKPPEEAIDEYLEDVQREQRESTYDSHSSRLGIFLTWCEENDIDSLHQLTGQDIKNYRDWRRSEDEWKLVTENTQMKTVRKFLRYCANYGWVSDTLPKRVPVPDVDADDEVREVVIRRSEAEDILSHLEKYKYASLEHCVWLILVKTGCRIGDLVALDLQDYTSFVESGTDEGILEIRDRPETGTPLKNGRESERENPLDPDDAEVIDDYIKTNRHDVTDDHGREPLLTTEHGRPVASTIRKYVYMWSRPCKMTGECPYDREIDECEAAQSNSQAYSCPTSKSPHPIRRGHLTYLLNQGMLPHVIAEKCDVSPEVLKKHYDERSDSEKREMVSMWMQMLEEQVKDGLRGPGFS